MSKDITNKQFLTTNQTSKAKLSIIFAQCAGAPASVFLANGFILSYLSFLNIESSTILKLLTIPSLISLFIMIPAAFISDKIGKKKVGFWGLSFTVMGFMLLTVAHFNPLVISIIALGIYSIGTSMFGSNWFAILQPIIPVKTRGRFFGKLRISWQSVSIVLSLIVTFFLKQVTSLHVFQIVIIILSLLLALRIFFYSFIPEVEKIKQNKAKFTISIREVIVTPNYIPFCSYTFLLSMFTGACPLLFGLLEKDVLQFTTDKIIMMGTLLMIGAVMGYYIGGIMVDKLGTKSVFMFCHFSFFLVLMLFVLRGFIPVHIYLSVGFLSLVFGLVRAASGIAITSELMSILPKKNKSLAAALANTLQAGAMAISGLVFAKSIDLNILKENWQLGSITLSQYDTLLLLCSIMILILVITLGLVPSVTKSVGYMPKT